MFKKLAHFVCALMLVLAGVSAALAEMAQSPLLTQSGSVPPNLVFVFDDSGSMDWDYIYQYGSSSKDTCAKASPDVNLIYYDPRVRYKLRIKANGDNMDTPAISTTGTTSFNVYFHQPALIKRYRVKSVKVTKGGSNYPNPDGTMTMTFTAPAGGGVAATGTVTVAVNTKASKRKVTAITVTSGGSGYVYNEKPTISFINNTSGGDGFKATITMEESSSLSSANQRWDGSSSNPITCDSGFFEVGTPAGYTPDSGSPLAVGAATDVAYPNTASKSVQKYPKFVNRTDCAGTVCTWAEELLNYKIWETYYKRRVDMARTGIGLAFKDFGPTFRLGWGAINTLESYSRLDAGVNSFTLTTTSGSRKQAFYDWLYGSNTDPGGDTPNRKAMDLVGKYLSRSDSDGPWGTNPSYTSTSTSTSTSGGTEPKTSHATCRRSNMFLVTDGYWNGASSGLGNIDGSNGPTITNPSGGTYQYKPAKPYSDTTADTLADVAMKYWYSDLRSDLDNHVKITENNPAFWQHASLYSIGLGVYGTLEPTDETLDSLSSSTDWPVAKADSATAIDDMWHAAVNSRGQFLSAGNTDELTRSMQSMMETINKLTSSQSGVAVSTANLVDGTRKFTPSYTTLDWTGNVTARNLDPITANEISTAWQIETVDPNTGAALPSLIPDASSRNIFVGTGNTTGTKAVAFTYAAMSAAGLTSTMGTTLTVNADLINYLRGDASKEGEVGSYRTRKARLGDIVNSSPVFVRKGIDFQYDKLPSAVPGASTYRSFFNTQSTAAEGVLFVGANDGMLHAFRDGTLADPEDGGAEVFAYVPKSVLPNLSLLADKAYTHRYYVDGPLAQTPLYSGSNWSTVLLGTTGAGAQSVFALNVTTPLQMNADSVMWEISSSSSGFGHLGHVISDVQAGITASGDWVAIFGNGFFGSGETASLFVVNLATGALIKEINTGVTGGNGLTSVKLVRNSTMQIVGAYAGDLKGNLWKFDLSGSSSSDWKVGLSGTPLYTAGSTAPITATPVALVHPSGGYLVSFATGKFVERTDIANTDQQRIYGVWDNQGFDVTKPDTGIAQTSTTYLVQQSISAGQTVTRTYVNSDLTTSTQSVTYFNISTNAVDWTAGKRGWYIDLPNTGERVVYPLNLLQGRIIAVDAISPSNVSSNPCMQTGQGTGWVYLIDGLTGSAPIKPILDTNGDGIVNSSDALSSGFTARADGRNTWLKVSASSTAENVVYAGISGGDGTGLIINIRCEITGTCPTGSKSIRSREWRQLFMR